MTYDTRARADLTVADLSAFWRPNLIINPEFTVNQRSAASRTATSAAYNYDRWYYDGTDLLQGVENSNLRNAVYTVSWDGASTCSYSLNNSNSSGQGSETYTAVTNGGQITISSLSSENLWLKFSSDLTNLTKVQLTQSNEAIAFVSRSTADELNLCYRYYIQIPTDCNVGTATTTSACLNKYFFPTTMRAAPTLSLVGTSTITVDFFGLGLSTSSSYTVAGTVSSCLWNVNSLSPARTAYKPTTVRTATHADSEL